MGKANYKDQNKNNIKMIKNKNNLYYREKTFV